MNPLSTNDPNAKDNDRAVRDTLNRVGDRWTIYVVRALRNGPKRFNQLKRKIKKISSRMLTLTLKKLERDGMVIRTGALASPSPIEYSLTPLGLTFLGPLGTLVAWADDHGLEVEVARERYDASRSPVLDGSSTKVAKSGG